MTATQAIEALKPYTDDFGFVHDSHDKNSGDTMLFTGHMVASISQLPGMLEARAFAEKAEGGVKACEIKIGLYRRHPVHYTKDQASQDQYIGAITTSSYAKRDIPWRVSARGFLSFWFFQTEPGIFWRAIFLRYPALIHHARECDRGFPTVRFGRELLHSFWMLYLPIFILLPAHWWMWPVVVIIDAPRIWWVVSLLLPKSNHDSWILPWNMCMANRYFVWYERLARKFFWKRMLAKWGDRPVQALFDAYFQKSLPHTKIAEEASWKVFGD